MRIRAVLERVKELGPEKVEQVAQKIFESTKPITTELEPLFPLNEREIQELANSGLVEIGAHTAHHEILTNITKKQAKQSIIKSITTLNEITGKYPRHFCYPNGDYSDEIIRLLSRLDIYSAVTVKNGFIEPKTTNRYELPRIPIAHFDSIYSFKAKLSGLSLFISNLLG
jgi:peptidoglycan/xylan/chitin deacetylase (PgdA/CDA1 family)